MILEPHQVGVSARHCHLTPEAVETLFGRPLTKKRDLYQPGYWLANERVIFNRKSIAVLGPARQYNQVEISRSDARDYGIDAPTRMSGDLGGAAPCVLLGPEFGRLVLDEAVIVAKPHVHMNWHTAAELDLGVKPGELVYLRVVSPRTTVFELELKIDSRAELEVHLDWDQANACDLRNASSAILTSHRAPL